MLGLRNFCALGVVLALLTGFAYRAALENDFVNYDDDAYITENAALRDGLTWPAVKWSFTAYHSGNWHPVTWLSHALDISLFGFGPAGHHGVNIIIHVLNALLVLALFSRYLGSLPWAFFIALLFAYHPLRVESVAWAAERKDLLCAFFYLALLLVYDRAQASRWRVGSTLSVVPVLFSLALMSKPMAITAPCLLLVLDVLVYGRWRGDTARARARCMFLLVAEKAPLWLLCVASAWLTVQAQQSAMASVEAYPLALRLGNAAQAYAWYAWKTVAPFQLAVIYPFDPANVTLARTALGATVMLALLGACAWLRNPRMLAGLLWYVGLLVPVIGLVQVGQQAYADRYSYLPCIGLVWMLVEAVRAAWRAPEATSTGKSMVLAVLAGALLVAYAPTRQVAHWRTSETLFVRALEVSPTNAPAHLNLGSYYYEHGDMARAVQHFEAAAALKPMSFDAQFNLGAALLSAGAPERAVEALRVAVSQQPANSEAQNNLGMAYMQLGDTESAGPHLLEAVRLNTANVSAQINLGVFYLNSGNKPFAARAFEEALRLEPGNAAAAANLRLCR